MGLLSRAAFAQQFQSGGRSASEHLRIDDSDLDIMFETDPVTASSLPDCPDKAEGRRDKWGHVSLGPVHVLRDILVGADGGNRIARGKRGIIELLSSSREMLVKLLADEIGLGRVVENL